MAMGAFSHLQFVAPVAVFAMLIAGCGGGDLRHRRAYVIQVGDWSHSAGHSPLNPELRADTPGHLV
jgi:hypothetical protein